MMNKTVIPALCILALLLCGCTNEESLNVSSLGSENDKTVKVPVEYEIGAYDVMEICSSTEYLISDSLSEMLDFSEHIVRGTIKNVTYTSFSGTAWTKVDVKVAESYYGDLKPGDVVSVMQLGGYIPLRDMMACFNIASRYESLSDEEINNIVLRDTVDNEPLPEIGEDNIYLLRSAQVDSGRPLDSYERVRETSSVFRVEDNEGIISRINPEAVSAPTIYVENGASTYGNKRFSLDEFLSLIERKDAGAKMKLKK